MLFRSSTFRRSTVFSASSYRHDSCDAGPAPEFTSCSLAVLSGGAEPSCKRAALHAKVLIKPTRKGDVRDPFDNKRCAVASLQTRYWKATTERMTVDT